MDNIIFMNWIADAQTRIRAGDAQTTHKMVGGVTLVGGNGSELTRLPGGAELNILPANGNALYWICFILPPVWPINHSISVSYNCH